MMQACNHHPWLPKCHVHMLAVLLALGMWMSACGSEPAREPESAPFPVQPPTTERPAMENPELETPTVEQVEGRHFFTYDAVDYYFNDYPEQQVMELFDNQRKSDLDRLKMEVIVGEVPKDESDLAFLQQMKAIGYTKKSLPKAQFAALNEIFVEKAGVGFPSADCIYVYRDILVFKQKGEVTGTAKICFECDDVRFTGTDANTGHFGEYGEFAALKTLLRTED